MQSALLGREESEHLLLILKSDWLDFQYLSWKPLVIFFHKFLKFQNSVSKINFDFTFKI